MKTRNKIIIAAVIVLLIILGIVLYRRNKKTSLIEEIKKKFPNYQADETVLRKKTITELKAWAAGDTSTVSGATTVGMQTA